MSNFEVETHVLLQSAENLERISSRVQNIAEEAKAVVNRTRSTISSRLIDSGKSYVLYSGISMCSTDMRNLSGGLKSAVDSYTLAEQRVLSIGQSQQYQSAWNSQSNYASIIKGVTFTDYIEGLHKKAFNYQDETGKNSDYIDYLSKIAKAFNKLTKKEGLSLTSDVFSYISALVGIADSSKNVSPSNVSSNFLTLLKSSGGLWNGIYKYYEKKLNPYDASKLSDKFGGASSALTVIGSLASLAKDGISVYDVFADPESNTYDKSSEIIKLLGSVGALGDNAYKTFLDSTKALQMVNTSGVQNQILANSELQYTTSKAVSSKASKATTCLALANVIASTLSSGVKRVGEVTEDGNFTLGDAGSVGVYGSLSGLEAISDFFTLGLLDFDSESIAADLESDVVTFMREDNWAANYINNTDNNAVLRFGLSIGVGGYLIGENVVEAVVNRYNTVASWGATAWNIGVELGQAYINN